MRFAMRNAPPPLDRFIETLWYWEGDPLAHRKDIILASAEAGLLINLADDCLRWYDGPDFTSSSCVSGIAVAGPNSRAISVDAFQRKMMGVKFRPGGAFPLFGTSISALADRRISLVDLWGPDANQLYERLVEASTPSGKFGILLHALHAKLCDSPERHPAVSHALDIFMRRYRVRTAAVAAEVGLSQKRFIKIFSAQVGLRPKLYLRIARFQHVLGQIAQANDVDWGDMVEGGGYYDQSHFINDFAAFSGLSPGMYLNRRGPHLQHVPIPS